MYAQWKTYKMSIYVEKDLAYFHVMLERYSIPDVTVPLTQFNDGSAVCGMKNKNSS